jgi:hypothetical protein
LKWKNFLKDDNAVQLKLCVSCRKVGRPQLSEAASKPATMIGLISQSFPTVQLIHKVQELQFKVTFGTTIFVIMWLL